MLSILTSCSENDHIYQRLIFYTILERITPDNRGCRGFRQALPRLHPLLKRITRLTGLLRFSRQYEREVRTVSYYTPPHIARWNFDI